MAPKAKGCAANRRSQAPAVEELRIFERTQIKRGDDLRLVIAVQIKRREAASCLHVVSPCGSGLIIPRVTRINLL